MFPNTICPTSRTECAKQFSGPFVFTTHSTRPNSLVEVNSPATLHIVQHGSCQHVKNGGFHTQTSENEKIRQHSHPVIVIFECNSQSLGPCKLQKLATGESTASKYGTLFRIETFLSYSVSLMSKKCAQCSLQMMIDIVSFLDHRGHVQHAPKPCMTWFLSKNCDFYT